MEVLSWPKEQLLLDSIASVLTSMILTTFSEIDQDLGRMFKPKDIEHWSIFINMVERFKKVQEKQKRLMTAETQANYE